MFNPVKSIQTVSEFTASLKGLIETSHPFVNLQGEVSNLRSPYSGHLYFILKDDQAQIRAVLFKGQRRFLQNDFKDGDQIICRGRITIYEQRGEYQIIVDSIQKAGYGEAHMQFLVLKEKLSREGLFGEEHKKRLPVLPHKICLITSPTGAAVHDFLKIALKKHPQLQIEIIPTPMQGDQAAQQLTTSLKKACARNWADIVVLCRGGGAIEDLWAFNDETLARTIAGASLPVVSAIGHETDFTLADFTADIRCPTPTAAAELIVPNIKEIKRSILQIKDRMVDEISAQITTHEANLESQLKFLGDPRSILDHHQLKIDHLVTQLELAFSKTTSSKQEQLHHLLSRLEYASPTKALERKNRHFSNIARRLISAQRNILTDAQGKLQRNAILLNAISPLAVLGRGYGIVTDRQHKPITSVQNVKVLDKIAIKMQDGMIQAEITDVTINTNT